MKLFFLLALCFIVSCCTLKSAPEEQFQQTIFSINKSIVSVSSNIDLNLYDTQTSSSVYLNNNTIGTGFVIFHEEKFTYILTAGHLCEVFEEIITAQIKRSILKTEEISSKTYIYLNFQNGQSQTAFPFLVSKKYDTCILITQKINIPIVLMSRDEPEVGKKYFMSGFPVGLGHGSLNIVPLFEGFYVGIATNPRGIDNSIFTIPVGPGASGSPVFDFDGNFVSVVHSQNGRFNHILYGATLKQIAEGIEMIPKIPLQDKEVYFIFQKN